MARQRQSRAAKCGLTDDQIDARLSFLERRMATADPKDLPYLNATYQRLVGVLVERDLQASPKEE